jgi:hypothetical protein
MPVVSQAQNRFFHWAEEHPAEAARRGVKPSVTKEFIGDQKPGSVKKLAEKVKPGKPAPKPWGSLAP